MTILLKTLFIMQSIITQNAADPAKSAVIVDTAVQLTPPPHKYILTFSKKEKDYASSVRYLMHCPDSPDCNVPDKTVYFYLLSNNKESLLNYLNRNKDIQSPNIYEIKPVPLNSKIETTEIKQPSLFDTKIIYSFGTK